MEKIGVELATEALNILKGTKEFVLDQAPDFMRQVLAWSMAESVIEIVAGVIGLSVGLYLIIGISYPEWNIKTYEQKEGEMILSGIAGLVLSVVGSIASLGGLYCAVKIHYAPKLFLLEYFASLVK